MTNQPADERPLAPPAPPPGPLWPEAQAPPSEAPSASAASEGGWPSYSPSADAESSVPNAASEAGPEATPAAAPTSGPNPEGSPGPEAASPGPEAAPPGAGAPPGGSGFGGQFAPGFMARYGLIRPVVGRHFAGVCAAVGRATNTDPVLWRVLFAVLTLFGGVGLLAYLIGWLLIPADGDTASPVEAVLGRGSSRTSAPVAVIGSVAAILVFALVASEGLRPAVVGALVVLGAAVLLSRGTLQRPGPGNQAPIGQPYGPQAFGAPPFGAPPHVGQPHAGQPHMGQPFGPQPFGAQPFGAQFGAPPTTGPFGPPMTAPHQPAAGMPASAATPAASAPEAATVPMAADPPTTRTSEPTMQKSPLADSDLPADNDPAAEPATEPGDDVTEDEAVPAGAHAVSYESPTVPQPATPAQPPALPYGGPFAPHGPFAPPGPYPPTFGPVPTAQTRRLPLYGPYPPIPGAGLPWDAPVSADPLSHYPGIPYSGPPVQQKRKEKRPKSRLGRVTLYATAIAVGTLAVVHLLGASIAGSAYFAVALTIVGLGLVAGARIGRARLLIPLGFALSLGLLISTASAIDGPHRGRGPEVLSAATVLEVTENNPFSQDTGDYTLDFSQVDFTGQNITFEATNDVGRLEIILPPNVDVTVKAKIEVGDADVFDSHWGGFTDQWRTVVDHGADGPNREGVDAGTLTLTVSVDVGNLEVHR